MGFRNPITTLDASQITGQLEGSQLAADAIDGKVITGATLRTDAAGNRVVVYDTAAGGVIELWAGGFPDEVPGTLSEAADAVNKTMTIHGGWRATQGNAGGVPAITFRPGDVGALDLAGGRVNLGSTFTQEVDINGAAIHTRGPVWNDQAVHFEWTTSGVAVPSGAVTGAGALTKDAVASVGTGPVVFATEYAVAGEPGIYAVSFFLALNAAATGRTFAEIQVSNVTVAREVFAGEETTTVSIPAIRLDSAKAVRGVVFHSSGAGRTLSSRLRLTLLERL